jgi:hypothetical protein
MRVIALIDDADVIRRILEHLGRWAPRQNQRAPPLQDIRDAGPTRSTWELTRHPVSDIA